MSLFKLKKLLPQAAKRSLYKYDCKNLGHGSSEGENLDSLIKSLEIVSPRPICHPPLHVIKNEIGVDLSIIIPVYNTQNFLGKCIDSCLGQRTEFSFEVIAVDDGSTDDSLAILRNYDFDHRLKVIHQKNRGHAGARNAALDVASGSYICFVDSDDFIPRDAVQRLMSRAIELDADIVGGGYWYCNTEGRRRRFKGMRGVVLTVPTAGLSGLPWGAVYRRSLWDDVRFPEGFWFEDTCLPYLIFSRSAKTASITGSVYYYRANPQGITATSAFSKKGLDSIWVVLEMFNEMERLGIEMTFVLYEQTLRQFGPLLKARLTALNDDELRIAFQCCSEIIRNFPERFGDFSTNDFWLKQIEEAMISCDYEKWLMACRWM